MLETSQLHSTTWFTMKASNSMSACYDHPLFYFITENPSLQKLHSVNFPEPPLAPCSNPCTPSASKRHFNTSDFSLFSISWADDLTDADTALLQDPGEQVEIIPSCFLTVAPNSFWCPQHPFCGPKHGLVFTFFFTLLYKFEKVLFVFGTSLSCLHVLIFKQIFVFFHILYMYICFRSGGSSCSLCWFLPQFYRRSLV